MLGYYIPTNPPSSTLGRDSQTTLTLRRMTPTPHSLSNPMEESEAQMTLSTPAASTTTGPNYPLSIERSLDQNEWRHGESNNETWMPESLEEDGTPPSGNPQTSSSPPIEETHSMEGISMPRLHPGFLPIRTDPYLPLLLEGTDLMSFDQGSMMNSGNWRPTSSSYLTGLRSSLDQRNMSEMVFDCFYHDEGTFGEGFIPSQNMENFPRFYSGYPELFPDSPPNP